MNVNQTLTITSLLNYSEEYEDNESNTLLNSIDNNSLKNNNKEDKGDNDALNKLKEYKIYYYLKEVIY